MTSKLTAEKSHIHSKQNKPYQKLTSENKMEAEAKVIQNALKNSCNLSFLHQLNYKIHKKERLKQGNPKNYFCPICKRVFQLQSGLFVHFNRCRKLPRSAKESSTDIFKAKVHTRKKGHFRCTVCEKKYKTHGYLAAHKLKCTGEKEKQKCVCPHCGKPFVELYNMQLHIRKNHDETAKPYTCDLCGFQNILLRNMDGHMRRRHLYKEHICDVCGKAFASLCELRPHMQIHGPEKKFKCDICEKSYAQKSGLTIHKIQAHEKRTYSCKICDLVFNAYMPFFHHNDIHKFPDGVKCESCGKSFKNRHFLTLHRRMAHGSFKGGETKKEKKFKCDSCEYAVSSKHLLVAHAVKHSGEKPFSCTICGIKFGWKRAVRAHEKSHH